MTLHLGYYHWKLSVLALLRESSHRSDERGPMLTSEEQRIMERSFKRGASPEWFVELLKARDAVELLEQAEETKRLCVENALNRLLSRDTSIGAP